MELFRLWLIEKMEALRTVQHQYDIGVISDQSNKVSQHDQPICYDPEIIAT